jgi:hypothetical protein
VTYYKVLADDCTPHHGGTGVWHPKKWRSVRRELIPCQRAIHACRREDLVYWLGPTIWTFEFADEPTVHENKVYGRKGRILERLETWNARAARLFACDCAERSLTHLTTPDHRLVAAIACARRFADGQATQGELVAARAAAWKAASAAAREPAWKAASAAGAAARDAGDAERDWQTARLFEYLDGKRP